MNAGIHVEEQFSAQNQAMGSHLEVALSRGNVVGARKQFFNSICEAMSTLPGLVDNMFDQDFYHIMPMVKANDPVLGNLVMELMPNYYNEGSDISYIYSIYHTGCVLRIGLYFEQSKLKTIPSIEATRQSLGKLWPNHEMSSVERGNGILHDWLFEDANPMNWLSIERYVLGMRHMHFRVLRLIHDTVYPDRISFVGNSKNR